MIIVRLAGKGLLVTIRFALYTKKPGAGRLHQGSIVPIALIVSLRDHIQDDFT